MKLAFCTLAFLIFNAAPACAFALTLDVTPPVSLVDQPISIRITRALPGANVTISATETIFGMVFQSSAAFLANAHGIVDPAMQGPLSGSYSGVDAMGLFWSMEPTAMKPAISSHSDYLTPRTVTFHASDGSTTAVQSIERRVIEPGIASVDVREPGLYARFYAHNDGQRHPSVIVLGGAEGGLPEERPAIIASHGFNTLSLAYFGVDDLPRSLVSVPIEVVKRAIDWLDKQPSVDASHIAVVGGSKGAELALVAASYFPQVRAVVALAPSSVVYDGITYETTHPVPSSWSYGGKDLPYVNGAIPVSAANAAAMQRKKNQPVSFVAEYLAQLQNATNLAEAEIPVERIRGPVLLVSGDDDRLWPSSFMANAIMHRLNSAHHPFNDRWLHYPGAGHDIGEPYYITTDSTIAHLPRYSIELGGTPQANEAASAQLWPQLIDFLKNS